jgi:hypothetical protein
MASVGSLQGHAHLWQLCKDVLALPVNWAWRDQAPFLRLQHVYCETDEPPALISVSLSAALCTLACSADIATALAHAALGALPRTRDRRPDTDVTQQSATLGLSINYAFLWASTG